MKAINHDPKVEQGVEHEVKDEDDYEARPWKDDDSEVNLMWCGDSYFFLKQRTYERSYHMSERPW